MAACKSIEHFTLSIAVGDVTSEETSAGIGALGLGQVTANCIPFATTRVDTHVSSPAGNVRWYQADVYFSGSSVIAEREARSDEGAITVEVFVVEFDPVRVNVYSDTYELSDGAVTLPITLGTTVNLAHSFAIAHAYNYSTNTSAWSHHLYRTRLTANDTLTIDRGTDSGDAIGHWYIAESIGGADWTVQTADIVLTGAASGSDTLTSTVDMGTSFVLGSYMKDTTGFGNDEATIEVWLADEDTVSIQRDVADNNIEWTGFVVTMTDGTSVERGRLTIGNQATTNVTITEVDRARALPRLTGLSGYTGASFPGPNASDVPAALLSAFLSSDTELRIEGSTEGNEASNDISWEVIEWAAAAATRRVMVIS